VNLQLEQHELCPIRNEEPAPRSFGQADCRGLTVACS